MKIFRTIISHVTIILGGMLLTLFIVDQINPFMEFINNDITRWLIAALSVSAIISAVLTLTSPKKSENKPDTRQ